MPHEGRGVLVGGAPIRMQRNKICRKELDFLISTSHGPGRDDPDCEGRGQDCPLAYVPA